MYEKQTMSKEDWELVIIDDMSDEDVLATLKEFPDLNWQYIRMDSRLNDFPIYWGPSLSNNIGFKAACGEVVAITGPEMLMNSKTLEYAYESAMQDQNVYGHVFHSSSQFVRLMDQNPAMEDYAFERLFSLRHAKVQDITKNTYYWFFCAVKREHVMSVNGCDETLISGVCADDDLWSLIFQERGIPNTHDFRIVGIHQDHKAEDAGDPKRKRRDPTWEKARLRNTKYLEEWATKRNKETVVNKGRDWGSDKLILSKIVNDK